MPGICRGDPLARPPSASTSDIRSGTPCEVASNLSVDGQASITNGTCSSGEHTVHSQTNHSELAEKGSSSALDSSEGRSALRIHAPARNPVSVVPVYSPTIAVTAAPTAAFPPPPQYITLPTEEARASAPITPNGGFFAPASILQYPGSPGLTIISPLPQVPVPVRNPSSPFTAYNHNQLISPLMYNGSPSHHHQGTAFIWPPPAAQSGVGRHEEEAQTLEGWLCAGCCWPPVPFGCVAIFRGTVGDDCLLSSYPVVVVLWVRCSALKMHSFFFYWRSY